MDVARSGTFEWMIMIFRDHNETDVRLAALRGCSIMCRTGEFKLGTGLIFSEENFQKMFVQAKGLPPTVQALYSSSTEMVELATFVISCLSMKLDLLRDHVLASNVLIPLNELVVGRSTERAQLLASNALSHLALSRVYSGLDKF